MQSRPHFCILWQIWQISKLQIWKTQQGNLLGWGAQWTPFDNKWWVCTSKVSKCYQWSGKVKSRGYQWRGEAYLTMIGASSWSGDFLLRPGGSFFCSSRFEICKSSKLNISCDWNASRFRSGKTFCYVPRQMNIDILRSLDFQTTLGLIN